MYLRGAWMTFPEGYGHISESTERCGLESRVRHRSFPNRIGHGTPSAEQRTGRHGNVLDSLFVGIAAWF